MAPSVRTPKGFVFVPREEGVAFKLLEAAVEVGADRHTSVRTVFGGYHVLEEVAQKYQEQFPAAAVDEGASSNPDDTTAESVDKSAESVDKSPSSDDAESGDGDELPVTADSSHAEIDEYAGSLDPKVEFPANTNRAEKIEILKAARNSTDQEQE